MHRMEDVIARRVAVAVTLLTVGGAAVAAQHAAHHAIRPAAHAASADAVPAVKQENQFVTVEEFVKSNRAPRTPVSVEGYAAVGYRAVDGSEHLELVDSIDHVLSARDADNLGHAGAKAVIPARLAARKAAMGWSPKGLERLVMYTGAAHAQKSLHDTVPKVRVTGWAAGHAAISPVAKVEYQDENGDWKAL